MNALSRFFIGVSTLFCLVIACPSTGFAVSANASPSASFSLTYSTQEVTISDRSYCEDGEVDCECPNGYVISGTVKRQKYSVQGRASPGCSYSDADYTSSTIDTWLTPDVSSLSSCEKDNVSSMSCGPIALSDNYVGQCITLNYSASCYASAQCYNSSTETYYTCTDSDSGSGSKTINVPPSIDGVQIYRGPPCDENDTDCPSLDCVTDTDCFNDFMNDSCHVGYQNGLRKNKAMSLQFFIFAALEVGDSFEATLSGAGVNKRISERVDEPLENSRLILEFEGVKPTNTGSVTLNLTVARNGCSASASYSVPVKADYCTYPVDESDTEDVCNLKYYFYDPKVECKEVEVPDIGEIEDIDANYNEDDLDYDSGIVEDFDAGMDWDAGVGLEELDANLDFDANISLDAGEIDAQTPDIPDFDAGFINFDGGAFSSGNDDPNNGGENSGNSDNGGTGSGSDAGNGTGGSSDSDAGFTGGIGLPSVDEDVDGGTGDGSGSGTGDGSGTGSGSGDEGPDSEFTGGDAGFSGGTSGDFGDSSADGSGNGNGSGSGSGNGSGSGGDGSGEAPEGGTGFTGGTSFPGGSGFDGYDWGSGDSQGETMPSAPDSGSGSGDGSGTGDGSGSGSGDSSGTGDGSGSGSGDGSGTGDGSGSGSGDSSGTGDGSGSGSGDSSGTGDGSGSGSGSGSGTGDGSGSGSGSGSGTGDSSGSGSGSGSGTGDSSGSGSGDSSGTGDGSGSGSGDGSGSQNFSLTGGVQKESTVTGCGGCSGSGASFLVGWLGLALLPSLRRRKRG